MNIDTWDASHLLLEEPMSNAIEYGNMVVIRAKVGYGIGRLSGTLYLGNQTWPVASVLMTSHRALKLTRLRRRGSRSATATYTTLTSLIEKLVEIYGQDQEFDLYIKQPQMTIDVDGNRNVCRIQTAHGLMIRMD